MRYKRLGKAMGLGSQVGLGPALGPDRTQESPRVMTRPAVTLRLKIKYTNCREPARDSTFRIPDTVLRFFECWEN